MVSGRRLFVGVVPIYTQNGGCIVSIRSHSLYVCMNVNILFLNASIPFSKVSYTQYIQKLIIIKTVAEV